MARDRLKGRKTLKVTGFLEEFEKDAIKDKVDIVALFAEFGISLSRKGKSYTGICPWHDDKKPSLSVDREKGLYNCFGCGESGDVFSLVEKIKGYDFKQALKYLQERAGSMAITPEVEKKPVPEPDLNLNTITGYYHKKLYENKQALDYLESRGLNSSELFIRFKLGYADGSLLNVSSNGQREALKLLGIVTDKNHEHFYNCITFPIFDEQQVISLYGRSIEGSLHLYLAGTHKSVFNRKASKVYDEIILTESIIDALSLIQLGLQNVQACYGTNGFTEEHLQILKDGRVKTVLIGFDNDQAGRNAAEKLKEKLVQEDFTVKIIFPPAGKDWNEYLLTNPDINTLKEQIEQAQTYKKQEEQQSFKVKKHGQSYEFETEGINYRLLGVKEVFVQDLKVNIKAQYGNETYYDKLDLYSARTRTSYSNNLAALFKVEPKRIEKDLVQILEYLEEQRDKYLNVKQEQDKLTPQEIELGEKFLTSKNIYRDIVEDMETLGYVGEEINKQLVYLVAVSRLLAKPLSVYIQAGSSSGKSYLLETVRKLLPAEVVKSLSSFSDQSLNYLKEEDFLDKIFMIGEAIHNEIIEGQIRRMQSENEISRLVTLKNPKTGELEGREIRHNVRISFMMSSTAMYLNPENASRCLVLHVDETPAQTARVLKAQRQRRTVTGYSKEKYLVPDIIKKHQAAQRLLQKIPVFNPFAVYLKFPKNRTTMRRSQEQFLSLIDSSCLLRQKQKNMVTRQDPYTQKEAQGIECDIEDYSIAYNLFVIGVLGPNFNDLPDGANNLYGLIREMLKKQAEKEKLKTTEITFIQKKVREYTDLGRDTVKKYIQMLVEYEYLQVIGGQRHGTRLAYRLREDKPIKEINLKIIPTPQEMGKLIKEKQTGEGGENWGKSPV